MEIIKLTNYQNRHGGFDLKDAHSTLLLPLASAKTQELADLLVHRFNAHEPLMKLLAETLEQCSENGGINLDLGSRIQAILHPLPSGDSV